jgi:hypothetical protein
VTLIEAPAQTHRGVHGVHGIQGDPERADSALQYRGISKVEFEALFLQQFAGLPRLLAPRFGEVHIGPAGEAVFQVPLALAMAHQNKFMHDKNRLKVEILRPFYNPWIQPVFHGPIRDTSWTFY